MPIATPNPSAAPEGIRRDEGLRPDHCPARRLKPPSSQAPILSSLRPQDSFLMSLFFTNLFFTGRLPAEARIGSALFGRLRDPWAIRRTRLSIAHLSDS